MRSAALARPFTAEEAARWLVAAGHGLLMVSTDEALARRLVEVMIREGKRLGRAPNDFDAIRAEMRRLWGEHERAGRSRECRRFHPDPSRRG
ncbi:MULTISPECIES: hypothetical protein [Methylorubrum]|uniref:hypothetical protein n=1 Tax=Methylorubrum TaxID=2282523 RepID=UPI00209F95E4|nr:MULTISPECIES: hypothetical protein [Methylorubrum]MCP1550661.1 hypothetical protein [Methylorubrum zatmanii]MCP1552726.1 hypothetical protein [Methylorubrum extorquens]MCP1580964.1 hypothetical protein [Methylorubrum extorquens]